MYKLFFCWMLAILFMPILAMAQDKTAAGGSSMEQKASATVVSLQNRRLLQPLKPLKRLMRTETKPLRTGNLVKPLVITELRKIWPQAPRLKARQLTRRVGLS